MKALVSVAIALTIGATSYTGSYTSSQASPVTATRDTPKCVSKKEFKKTPKNTRIGRAHRIYDTKGRYIDGAAGGFVRDYRFCKKARKQARAKRFTVSYSALGKHPRIALKYCGPTYKKRRHCF